jgi:hypothetical protein
MSRQAAGVLPRTVYKWLARKSADNLSSRARQVANRLVDPVIAEIASLRRQHIEIGTLDEIAAKICALAAKPPLVALSDQGVIWRLQPVGDARSPLLDHAQLD